MGYTSTDIRRLIAELTLDLSLMEPLVQSNQRAETRIQKGATDELDYAALGYTIHNIYGCIENTCLRISKFFENGLTADTWHKDLLRRMLLHIPEVRPAFFTLNEYEQVDELRGFRHLFRNIYNTRLDPQRVLLVQQKVPAAIASVDAGIDRYMNFLSQLCEKLEETSLENPRGE